MFRTYLLCGAAGAALALSLHPASAQGTGNPPIAGREDIIVTALGLEQAVSESATPVITLSGRTLTHQRQASLGETLAGLPGVKYDSFGTGASRPVIRGQSSPRVLSLSDGGRISDASSVSPDHAISTEPLLLRGIEVLRGPATLLYGGGAIGGAVNLLDEKVPTHVPESGYAGALEGRLSPSDNERTAVGGVTLGLGQFALRLEGVTRTADDYGVHHSFGPTRVPGTFGEGTTYTVGGSWIGADGYLGAAYTNQRSNYGVPGHNHAYESCHPHGVTLHCGGHEEEEEGHDHDHDHEHDHDEDAAAGTPDRATDVPVVNLRNERIDVRGEYRNLLPLIERVKLRVSFSDYAHDEVEDGAVENTFTNKAHEARLEVTHAPIAGLRGVFGFQNNGSDATIVGSAPFLPPNRTDNSAIFLLESFELGAVRLELAARQEWQSIDAGPAGAADHTPFSISGGAVWNIDGDYSLALSVARSQRAPTAQELFSNTVRPFRGVHLASNTWEIGTPTLGSETSHSVDLTFRKTLGDTTFTLGGYHQSFSDYIFAETLDRFEEFRLVRYTAADATFTGLDGEIRHQFTPGFAASIFGDYVRAELAGNLGNVPRIPAGRLGVRAEGSLDAFSTNVELYHVFEQGDIAAFETRTPGYTMLNVTLAYHIDLGLSDTELFLRATNLTDSLAFNHSSFIKNAAPLRGRNLVFGLRTTF